MTECLFCKIIKKQIPAKIVYEDEKIIAFHDINPQAPVHFLVIPKKHISAIAAMDSQDEPLIGYVMHMAKKLAENVGIEKEGYRVVINNGPNAGQAVAHIHIHVIGGRKLQWPPG